MDISGPPSANTDDWQFFTALNNDGRLKVFNYSVIENHQSHSRFAKDYFKVRIGHNQSKPLEETLGGQKMIDQGYPLKFKSPL